MAEEGVIFVAEWSSNECSESYFVSLLLCGKDETLFCTQQQQAITVAALLVQITVSKQGL